MESDSDSYPNSQLQEWDSSHELGSESVSRNVIKP